MGTATSTPNWWVASAGESRCGPTIVNQPSSAAASGTTCARAVSSRRAVLVTVKSSRPRRVMGSRALGWADVMLKAAIPLSTSAERQLVRGVRRLFLLDDRLDERPVLLGLGGSGEPQVERPAAGVLLDVEAAHAGAHLQVRDQAPARAPPAREPRGQRDDLAQATGAAGELAGPELVADAVQQRSLVQPPRQRGHEPVGRAPHVEVAVEARQH